MPTKLRVLAAVVGIAAVGGLLTFLASRGGLDVLSPAGTVAAEQRNLMIVATALMLLVVIPVFVLTGFIAYKYRASNAKADYQPNWDHNTKLETIWWLFPCAIILVLAVITWTSSHSLDPMRPIASDQKPLTIQVVALEWKWLFLYPEQDVASVNLMPLPVNRPINLQITADAPMNSLWIPKLGGQIYAMAGMTTQLHLQANQTGDFRGSSANLSGPGFSSMHFTARATNQDEFDSWVAGVKTSAPTMSISRYEKLAAPSVTASSQYSPYDESIYNHIMTKYMSEGHHVR